MDLRQLEALVAIADHGTFSRAADALGTVQSNISSRIARLEGELGAELVDRSSGAVSESGGIVVHRARRILNEVAAIALLLEAQRSTYPHIALRIIEGSNSTLEPQVVNGQLDLAVLAWPVLAPELTKSDLFSEDLVVIVAREHPLALAGTPVTFETLAQYELLLPLPGTTLRRELDLACREHGVELKPLLELDGLRTIASLTFDGHGPSILPATIMSQHLTDKFVPVRIEGMAKRRVSLVTRRFGFPAAPVRAIDALLHSVVHNAVNAPKGVYIPTESLL